jgi:formylglycine-generating enzyme required for sulfatase activity
MEELRTRLDWARRIETMTIGEHRAEWDTACREILDEKPYLFALKPQVGLVPLGRDPVSRLQEFGLLLPHTDLPKRTDGKLVIGARTCPVFVLLPGGEVTVGAQRDDPAAARYDQWLAPTEDALDLVTLQPFFAGKYEFTNGNWAAVLAGPHEYEPPTLYDGPLQPAVNFDATWMQHILSAWGMRLPTWQEWEYLARGGSNTPFAPGASQSDLEGHANLLDLTARGAEPRLGEGEPVPWWDKAVFTAPVGSYRANGFGLHDVHGNALEPAERTNQDGVTVLELRGGSWNQGAARARILFAPKWSKGPMYSIGFRPVISVVR